MPRSGDSAVNGRDSLRHDEEPTPQCWSGPEFSVGLPHGTEPCRGGRAIFGVEHVGPEACAASAGLFADATARANVVALLSASPANMETHEAGVYVSTALGSAHSGTSNLN